VLLIRGDQRSGVKALEPRRRDCRDVIQRAIGRGELWDPQLATALFELAIGRLRLRFPLQSDGFRLAPSRTSSTTR